MRTPWNFAVSDTGVGIPENQHRNIFEAFQQADGSIHRKFGGTGLGLSISRDLAQRLGGQISLQSIPGKGSVFTLTLPHVLPEVPSLPRTESGSRINLQPSVTALPRPPRPSTSAHIGDDRGRLSPQAGAFSLSKMMWRSRYLAGPRTRIGLSVHHHPYRQRGDCSRLAEYQPSAILLDVNLPDYSGLGVLEQLKRNSASRHIPVHMISVADHTQGALELGAVGYALKPVSREQLITALKRLESKLSQRVRRCWWWKTTNGSGTASRAAGHVGSGDHNGGECRQGAGGPAQRDL